MIRPLTIATTVCFLLGACSWNCQLQANLVTNGSFETPAYSPGGYAYNPGGAAWTFNGNSGITSDQSSPFGGPLAPDGQQYAFLQSDGTNASQHGSFVQSLSFASAGTYQVTYSVAGRNYSGYTGNVTYDLLLDAAVIVNDESTTSGQPFTAKSFQFSSAAGTHTLTFKMDAAQPLGDNTAFFDVVQVVAIPEASGGLAILVAGAAAGMWQIGRRFTVWTASG